MSKTVTLELADNLYNLLVEKSNQRGLPAEQMIVEWLEERIRLTADDSQITPDFAQQLDDFIQEYRPALEALAK